MKKAKNFIQTQDGSGETAGHYGLLGEFSSYEKYSLTKYDATDKLKVYFTMTTMEGSKDVVIELERK